MLKVLSLFSGIGAFEKALKRQNISFVLENYCEIDKYASKAYSLIHEEPESKNLGDITKVDEKSLSDFDLITWGFPCQDISIAGKQKGIIQGETRSGLYYEGLRILKEKKPKYSIIENVKALTQKKFKKEFKQILADLDEAGYNNYWHVLNAKNYGVPQNRERVFIISIRKDIDDGKFSFPKGFDSGIRLKDVLQNDVDKKYYINQEKTNKLIETLKNKSEYGAIQINKGNLKYKEDDISSCLDANYYKGLDNHAASPGILETEKSNNSLNHQIINLNPKNEDGLTSQQDRIYDINDIMTSINAQQNGRFNILLENTKEENKILQIGNIVDTGNFDNPQRGRIYSPSGISPSLNTVGGGGLEPKIIEKTEQNEVLAAEQRTDEGLRLFKDNIMGTIRTTNSSGDKRIITNNCKELFNINPSGQGMSGRIYDSEYISPTLDTTIKKCLDNSLKIRKLTPLECFRLMGFDDEDYYILKENNTSDSKLYKMAGNSIVVNVLESIFNQLFNKKQ